MRASPTTSHLRVIRSGNRSCLKSRFSFHRVSSNGPTRATWSLKGLNRHACRYHLLCRRVLRRRGVERSRAMLGVSQSQTTIKERVGVLTIGSGFNNLRQSRYAVLPLSHKLLLYRSELQQTHKNSEHEKQQAAAGTARASTTRERHTSAYNQTATAQAIRQRRNNRNA